ncbi:S41 family peptidase [Streptomyces sp. NBC_00654]|uniref:S41 family peptidase n=1 Tax=Streptomyces sp. NBC_00654 TaxID=2975799 RepID=UPI002252D84F|nr:S41 family peptidase [Streptomyces sp. NBC_00654]MCX4966979.1 S41 family peptidase [Streptomyces sp. NBC_00654]
MSAAALAVMLTACVMDGGGGSAHPRSSDIDGTWRSAGYGTVYVIKQNEHSGARELSGYENSGTSCVKGDAMTALGGERDSGGAVSFGEDGDRELTVRRQGGHLLVQESGSVGHIRMNRLKVLPHCPSETPNDGPARRLKTLDVFWQNLSEHYPPYAHRRLDLRDRERDHATLKGGNTDRTLEALLRRTVRKLGDMHTGITWKGESSYGLRPGTRDSADLTDADIEAARSAIKVRLGAELRPVIEGKVEYATGLPGGTGYLRITQLKELDGEESSYDDDLARFKRALDTVFIQGARDHWRGLILDLRLNDGGHDALGQELASRLTRHPHVAFKKRARDLSALSGFTPYETVNVRPSRYPGFHGRLALLVSDLTVSAGETTAMTLLNRSPAPTLIGRDTQGIFSDQLSRTLPGGTSLDLSNEDYRNSAGQSFEGRGLPVDARFRTPVFTSAELEDGCDSALAMALDHLGHRKAGTTPRCPTKNGG